VDQSGGLRAEAGKRENPGGDKGAERAVEPRVGHGVARGGSHHGVGDASVLHPHHGGLRHATDDARHSAHAVRISARLSAPQPVQRRITIDAHLGQTDCRGQPRPTASISQDYWGDTIEDWGSGQRLKVFL